jgi:glycosyltransferase involved in cell wall biosynthesis
LYRHAQIVVTQTTETADWVKDNCPGSRVSVIPNPITFPIPRYEPVLDPNDWVAPNQKTILAVGRLGPEKGFDILLESFANLKESLPRWDLVVLGDGPLRESLELQRDQLGLHERVHFPGAVGNVSDWYSHADIFILSSRFEGFPNVLLEALAHGLPAISFDCLTGPSDLVCHGQNGLLVPIDQGVDGLGAAIRSLAENKSLREQMAGSGADVVQMYAIQNIGTRWNEIVVSANSGSSG